MTVCRCRACGLHFPQPIPIPQRLEDHYGVPPESYWKASYFEVQEDYFCRQIADAKRLLTSTQPVRVLDIGAGIGKAMIAMGRSGFDCWGIEPSKPFYDRAIEEMGMSPERLQMKTLEAADFGNDFFDFITFGAVLEHLYSPSAAIERTLSWLRPGGVIHIEVPSSYYMMSVLLNTFYLLRGTNYVTNLSPMHAPFHIYEFTLNSFRAHASQAGYEIVHSYHDVAPISHVPSVAKPALRAWMKARKSGMQLTVWLRKPDT